ncbi:hypothetical protein Tco_0107606, partial [Tanacetum coccineum]
KVKKDKKKQNQSKTDKEMEKARQELRREVKSQSRISLTQRKKVKAQMKAQGSMWTSFKSLKALLDVLKFKG